ncbi:MAG: four helix bundle protein [Cyclobacteriaceae bacterium]
MTSSRKYDLNERLIDYAVMIINIVGKLPSDRVGNHLGGQLLRSGTSPALNYGEAQGAESKKDFIHKLKIGLKELRESYNCLKIIERSNTLKTCEAAIKETDELIAIFVKSIETTQKRQ